MDFHGPTLICLTMYWYGWQLLVGYGLPTKLSTAPWLSNTSWIFDSLVTSGEKRNKMLPLSKPIPWSEPLKVTVRYCDLPFCVFYKRVWCIAETSCRILEEFYWQRRKGRNCSARLLKAVFIKMLSLSQTEISVATVQEQLFVGGFFLRDKLENFCSAAKCENVLKYTYYCNSHTLSY